VGDGRPSVCEIIVGDWDGVIDSKMLKCAIALAEARKVMSATNDYKQTSKRKRTFESGAIVTTGLRRERAQVLPLDFIKENFR